MDASSYNSSLQWTFCSDSIFELDDTTTERSVSEVMSFKNTSALCGDLRFIMSMPEMCDVKFLVGPLKVAVYGVKSILATRSRIFYELLLIHQKKFNQQLEAPKHKSRLATGLQTIKRMCTPSKSKQATTHVSTSSQLIIDINDFDAEIFRLVVMFLHCGKVDLNITNLVGVMNAADAYGVEDLCSGCFRFAEKLLQVDTVLPLLTSTEKYSRHKWTKYLNEKIMAFIREKAQDVLKQPEFEDLSKHIVILIFASDELKATEETKWDSALRWTKRYSHGRELNHFRRNLKMFTRRIHFSEIPLHKLQSEILPLSIVPEHVINNAISHQRCPRVVIGQERKSSTTPRKPPRKGMTPSTLFSSRGSANVRRTPSSASSNSDSSGTDSCDSGFSSS